MKIKFSETQIDAIIKSADSAWRHNQMPKSRKENFLLTLENYLSETGTIENVCHRCLGTGKETA